MHYYEVSPRRMTSADGATLTYHSEKRLPSGQLVRIPLGKRFSSGLIVKKSQQPDFATKALESIDTEPLPQPLLKTILWMAEYYGTPPALVLNSALPAGLEKTRRATLPELPQANRNLSELELTSHQRRSVREITRSEDTSVLRGETGSGKTLIYRELIRQQLAAGKSALLLVPEIGLTPQALSDYRDLSEHIFVTHSQLTEAQRHKIWLNILQHKQPKLVIGPRSALFSPLANLGVVIIDEEHEPAYKQDTSPKYQAQTVAAFLCRQHNAKLVLASATPRIQAVYMSQERRQPVLTVPSFHERQPDVQIIDRTNKDSFSRNHNLSSPLLDALSTTYAQEKQSLVYLNRRGSATYILCNDCGWSARCPRCDIGLVLHHDRNEMRCHQCGYKQAVLKQCPECANPDIRFRGAGTKRIESDLKRLYPEARIARFDSDSVAGGRLHDRYQELYEGKVDIIIGTQAIARSLDLPLLDTVGVVSADSELLLPDFSATERAFQLLYQVIGRVGRTTGKGRVIIQTHNPDHPAIDYALRHDYQGFFDHEIQHRRAFGYPPFKHLLALVATYRSRAKAQEASTEMAAKLHRQAGLQVLGPAPAFYERRGSSYRWFIVVKSHQRSKLLEVANQVRSSYWQIDLDPNNLLF